MATREELTNTMINAIMENNQNPSPQAEQLLQSAQQQLAQFDAKGPDAASNAAANEKNSATQQAQRQKDLKTQKRDLDMEEVNTWMDNENRLGQKRAAEKARINSLDVRENHIYDRGRSDKSGRGPQSLQTDAAQHSVMGDFQLYGGMERDGFLDAADNRETSFQEPYPGMLDGGASLGSIRGMAGPTPPGSPTHAANRAGAQGPMGGGQADPFMPSMALNDAGSTQQAELAAVYDQARLAQEAAYKDRLNPFGVGSGYEDLQRRR